jgi:hypothetical protein
MQKARSSDPAVEALVGFAGDGHGNGLAYARVTGPRSSGLVRTRFRVSQSSPVTDRAISYAALTSILQVLRKRGVREVRLVVGDQLFADEVSTGRGVGETVALPYVRLRCVLNSLAGFSVRVGPTDDLTQRARAEVALNVAA